MPFGFASIPISCSQPFAGLSPLFSGSALSHVVVFTLVVGAIDVSSAASGSGIVN
jgi:hypothetical protein